jgi:hypothetical protein
MYNTPKGGSTEPQRPDSFESWKWQQYINRYWMAYLSPSEFMVLLFILDRTLGWNKDSEVITRRQMLKGVASRGTLYHRGLSLSASTIDTTLNRLEEKGVIERRRIMRGVTTYVEFEINLLWSPSDASKRLHRRRARSR